MSVCNVRKMDVVTIWGDSVVILERDDTHEPGFIWFKGLLGGKEVSYRLGIHERVKVLR